MVYLILHKMKLVKRYFDLSLLDEEEKKILKSIYDLLLQKNKTQKKRPYYRSFKSFLRSIDIIVYLFFYSRI